MRITQKFSAFLAETTVSAEIHPEFDASDGLVMIKMDEIEMPLAPSHVDFFIEALTELRKHRDNQ